MLEGLATLIRTLTLTLTLTRAQVNPRQVTLTAR